MSAADEYDRRPLDRFFAGIGWLTLWVLLKLHVIRCDKDAGR